MQNIWEIINSLAAAIQAIAVMIALIYAAYQLRQASKERHLSLTFKFYEIFSDHRYREARFHIFNHFPPDPKKLTLEDYQMARNTWNLMNQIGVIAFHNLASKKFILELYSRPISRLWHKLEPHILYYRKKRGDFVFYFEWLAKQCQKYRKQKYGEDTPHFYKSEWIKSRPEESESQIDDEGFIAEQQNMPSDQSILKKLSTE